MLEKLDDSQQYFRGSVTYFFYSLVMILTTADLAFAYVDPGTGSMLLQIIAATVIGSIFAIRQKLKLLFARFKAEPSGEKVENEEPVE